MEYQLCQLPDIARRAGRLAQPGQWCQLMDFAVRGNFNEDGQPIISTLLTRIRRVVIDLRKALSVHLFLNEDFAKD